jgi:hypothetical protein
MPIQGSSEIVTAIRAKLADGRLPLARPSQMWAGHGTGEPCDACDQSITRDDVEYESSFFPVAPSDSIARASMRGIRNAPHTCSRREPDAGLTDGRAS